MRDPTSSQDLADDLENEGAPVRVLRTRLQHSRQELHELLIDDPQRESQRRSEFPRSKVMQVVFRNRNAAMLALGAGGLLLWRPGLIMTALRALPVGALVRMAAAKLVARKL
jgi:hypothetical protein